MVVMLISSAVTWSMINSSGNAQARVIEIDRPTIDAGNDLLNAIDRALAGSRGNISMKIAGVYDRSFESQWQGAWRDADDAMKKLKKASANWGDNGDRKQLSKLEDELREFENIQQSMSRSLSESSGTADLARVLKQDQQISEQIRGDLERLIEDFVNASAEDMREVVEGMQWLRIIIAITSLLMLVIGLGVSVFISGMITKSLNKVITRAKKIAAGDLSGKALDATSQDEMGELSDTINNMGSQLHNLIGRISVTSSEFRATALQLDRAVGATNTAVELQHAETEQVATAMNEMTATIQDVARNASDAAESANKADRFSSEGRSVVNDTVSSIGELASGIEQATISINNLGAEANKVDDIVAVISGIAEQTNLLALNAAIEAARAGEQGRGFAVVADEVRTLAARTQESTEEIRSMLDVLKAGANESVVKMETGQKQAQTCVSSANSASDSLKAIEEAVSSIASMNIHMATAAEQQTSVSEEMNRNIVNINDKAEMILKSSNEAEETAKKAASLAEDLDAMISEFKL